MLGARSPFSSPWGFGITGSPSAGWTFTKTAQASTAETIATWNISDDATGFIGIRNGTTSDSTFAPRLTTNSRTTNISFDGSHGITTDSGTNPAVQWNTFLISGGAVSTRPLYSWYNNNVAMLQMLPLNSGANSALSWGTQTTGIPTFTTRSAGTRLVLFSDIGASSVDYAIGVGDSNTTTWFSIANASSSRNFKWYAAATNVMSLTGEGKLTTTGGRIEKVRIALTTPVTVAAGTDHNVITKLTTPGAVAVNLPAGVAGQRFIIQDGTGDAAANNVTITPAAGTINGAATLVIAANYGRADLVYDGATWLSA